MNDNYAQYENSFQTVPSSIPHTPSPEQWPPNELNAPGNLMPTGQNLNNFVPNHLNANYGSPMHHCVDPIGINKMNNTILHPSVHQGANMFHPTSIDGKPFIQASVLAGKSL